MKKLGFLPSSNSVKHITQYKKRVFLLIKDNIQAKLGYLLSSIIFVFNLKIVILRYDMGNKPVFFKSLRDTLFILNKSQLSRPLLKKS